MKYHFNKNEIVPRDEYKFKSALKQQEMRSEGADGIFSTGWRKTLPKYIISKLKELGYTYCTQIGSTTYVSSTWAVWKQHPKEKSDWTNELR